MALQNTKFETLPTRQATTREWWPLERRKQFNLLRELVHEVSLINNGSSCLQRIQRCIDYAKSLTKFDSNFLYFLEEEMFSGNRPQGEASHLGKSDANTASRETK